MDHCFLHRIAGLKPHLKKSQPATFHKVVPLASYFWSFKSTREIHSYKSDTELYF